MSPERERVQELCDMLDLRGAVQPAFEAKTAGLKHEARMMWLALTPIEQRIYRLRFPDHEIPTCDCAICTFPIPY